MTQVNQKPNKLKKKGKKNLQLNLYFTFNNNLFSACDHLTQHNKNKPNKKYPCHFNLEMKNIRVESVAAVVTLQGSKKKIAERELK